MTAEELTEEDPEKQLKIMADILENIIQYMESINTYKKMISLKEDLLKEKN
jgi:hypothetical protein